MRCPLREDPYDTTMSSPTQHLVAAWIAEHGTGVGYEHIDPDSVRITTTWDGGTHWTSSRLIWAYVNNEGERGQYVRGLTKDEYMDLLGRVRDSYIARLEAVMHNRELAFPLRVDTTRKDVQLEHLLFDAHDYFTNPVHRLV